MTTPIVLLVDDNEGNRDLMELHLEGLPVRCMTASDGQGAQICRPKSARFDLAGRHDAQDEWIRGVPGDQE